MVGSKLRVGRGEVAERFFVSFASPWSDAGNDAGWADGYLRPPLLSRVLRGGCRAHVLHSMQHPVQRAAAS